MTDVGASLASARLVTRRSPASTSSGNGKFKINDVEITYKATDSITSIVNRINASTAGVSAFYDPVQDRLRFSASQTGARTMTLEDTQGNFLAATGVLGATQQLGQNAALQHRLGQQRRPAYQLHQQRLRLHPGRHPRPEVGQRHAGHGDGGPGHPDHDRTTIKIVRRRSSTTPCRRSKT